MNWQRPDFRNEGSYPADLSGAAWAWEFLRRNDDYLEECTRFCDFDPNSASEELKQAYDTACRRFSVNMLASPDRVKGGHATKVDLLFRISDRPAKILITGVNHLPENQYQVAFQFDLRYPLQEQLDFAKSELEAVQRILESPNRLLGKPATRLEQIKKNQLPQKGNFVTYLRLLDWEHECPGQSLSELVPILFPEGARNEDRCLEKRLRANLKAAHEIVKSGYVRIAEFGALSSRSQRKKPKKVVKTKLNGRKKIVR